VFQDGRSKGQQKHAQKRCLPGTLLQPLSRQVDRPKNKHRHKERQRRNKTHHPAHDQDEDPEPLMPLMQAERDNQQQHEVRAAREDRPAAEDAVLKHHRQYEAHSVCQIDQHNKSSGYQRVDVNRLKIGDHQHRA